MKKFGFGLMRLPVVNGNYNEVDIPKMTEMVDAFLEAGGTYFDPLIRTMAATVRKLSRKP